MKKLKPLAERAQQFCPLGKMESDKKVFLARNKAEPLCGEILVSPFYLLEEVKSYLNSTPLASFLYS
ncbi:MAG: hypothetical protein ACE5EK_09490 [Nitrospinales bacterium]